MTGSDLVVDPTRLPKGRRAFKGAWLQISLTATDGEGRSRTTSIAYGMAPSETGIPNRSS